MSDRSKCDHQTGWYGFPLQRSNDQYQLQQRCLHVQSPLLSSVEALNAPPPICSAPWRLPMLTSALESRKYTPSSWLQSALRHLHSRDIGTLIPETFALPPATACMSSGCHEVASGLGPAAGGEKRDRRKHDICSSQCQADEMCHPTNMDIRLCTRLSRQQRTGSLVS